MQHDVVVIGGGVAGLTCAIELHKKGRQVLVLEEKNQVGGRIATENVDGFLLDRGFQVLQTGYPDIGSYLDLERLHLKNFPAGGCSSLVKFITHEQSWVTGQIVQAGGGVMM